MRKFPTAKQWSKMIGWIYLFWSLNEPVVQLEQSKRPWSPNYDSPNIVGSPIGCSPNGFVDQAAIVQMWIVHWGLFQTAMDLCFCSCTSFLIAFRFCSNNCCNNSCSSNSLSARMHSSFNYRKKNLMSINCGSWGSQIWLIAFLAETVNSYYLLLLNVICFSSLTQIFYFFQIMIFLLRLRFCLFSFGHDFVLSLSCHFIITVTEQPEVDKYG